MNSVHKNASAKEWWEDDGGFFGAGYMRGDDSLVGYLPSRRETLTERTEREVSGVIELLALSPGTSVIDVPCGYGRHLRVLAQHGIECTGVDINTAHLDKARVENFHENVRFVRADMRSFASEIGVKADAVTNMFFSFGFFATDDENAVVLRQFYAALKPGGRCLIHTDVSPEMIENGRYRLSEERQLGGALLKIHEHYDLASRRLLGSWTIEGAKESVSLTPYSVRIYSALEFTALFRDAGFHQVRCYGDFAGVPFGPTSEELIVVGEK